MEEWDPAINDFVLRCNSCWRTNKQTNISKLSVLQGRNTIVNSVWVFMIYAIVKLKNRPDNIRRFADPKWKR